MASAEAASAEAAPVALKSTIIFSNIPDEILCIIFGMVFDFDKTPISNLRLICKKAYQIFYQTLKTYKYMTFDGRERYYIRKIKAILLRAPCIKNLIIKNTGEKEKQKVDALYKCFPEITSIEINNCYHFFEYIDMLLPNMKNVTKIITKDVNSYTNIKQSKLIAASEKLKFLLTECSISFNELFDNNKNLIFLSVNRINREIPLDFDGSNMKNLRVLAINYYPYDPTNIYKVLADNCPELRELKLRTNLDSSELFSNTFISFTKKCPKITILDLCSNASIINKHIYAITNNMRDLTELKLNYNANISGKCLKYLAGTPKLRVLELGNIIDVDSDDLNFCEKTPLLEVFSMMIKNVSDDALISVFKNCPKLSHIYLQDAVRITEKSIKYILDNNISGIVNIIVRGAKINSDIFKDLRFRNYDKLKMISLDRITFRHEIEETLEFDEKLTTYLVNFSARFSLTEKLYISTKVRNYCYFGKKLYSTINTVFN